MKDINQKLQNIGLTAREAKVYLYLLQVKESKAGPLCSKLDIRSSHIYTILEKLLDKGIISYKIINNVKIYRPVSPESLFALFKEKERQLQDEKKDMKEFITHLKKIETKLDRQNDFKYFEGINGVKSMFVEFMESWEKNSRLYIAASPLALDHWNAFFMHEFQPLRKKMKIHQQLLLPNRLKKHGEERKKFKPIEIKYHNVELESEFGVAGDHVYFLSKGEKPYALLIKDENLAKAQTKIFNVLWKNAKP